MRVDDYYRDMGVKHDKDCNVCDDYKLSYETHTSLLRRFWEKEYAPLVLVIILCLAVYIVGTSKLIEYIVGGI
jgi:hypothetical protein